MSKKIIWDKGNMLYPLPVVMVSCGETLEEYNIITIAWTGTVCSNPPMCYISVRKNRHSYQIIERTKEFVINLTTKKLAYATDWCGVKSGKTLNKFQEMKLTPEKATKINAPLIAEAPVNIECVVKQIIPLGSHDMFLADVVCVNVDPDLLDKTTGNFELEKAKLITYSHGFYYHVADKIGKFGYSVEKQPKEKERWRKNKS